MDSSLFSMLDAPVVFNMNNVGSFLSLYCSVSTVLCNLYYGWTEGVAFPFTLINIASVYAIDLAIQWRKYYRTRDVMMLHHIVQIVYNLWGYTCVNTIYETDLRNVTKWIVLAEISTIFYSIANILFNKYNVTLPRLIFAIVFLTTRPISVFGFTSAMSSVNHDFILYGLMPLYVLYVGLNAFWSMKLINIIARKDFNIAKYTAFCYFIVSYNNPSYNKSIRTIFALVGVYISTFPYI